MPKTVLIITGYSGAGKSSVLKALEDIGFFCIDNLPIDLLSNFLLCGMHNALKDRIALGIDSRCHQINQLLEIIDRIDPAHCIIKIFFITAHDHSLIKRFQETRRKHPLHTHQSLSEAIEQEKRILLPLLQRAETIIETDFLSIHQLRALVRSLVITHKVVMTVQLVSFGFKYGIPLESTMVFDVRFLPNPFFVPHLKQLDGTSKPIQEYLFEQSLVQTMFERLYDFVVFCCVQSLQEGRFNSTIAIGCTGGRHRSVAVVEKFAQRPHESIEWVIRHRDIHNKDNYLKQEASYEAKL